MNLRKDHCRNLREQIDPRTCLQEPKARVRPGTNPTPARIAPRTLNKIAPRAAGLPACAVAACRFYATERLSATDISSLASMKNVAKCDTWCELQNPVNHRVFERKLRPKPSWPGHVCLGVTHRVAPPPHGGRGGNWPPVHPRARLAQTETPWPQNGATNGGVDPTHRFAPIAVLLWPVKPFQINRCDPRSGGNTR